MAVSATGVAPGWILDHDDIREEIFSSLQSMLSYEFRDSSLLLKCFQAGDSNSSDREGHRGLAQVGDTLMGLVVICDGTAKGHSRAALQTLSSAVKSKEHCARIAKMFRFDEWVKISERQNYIGVQPTTLKNVVAALVGAVWMDSFCDYRAVLKVMIQMSLLNNTDHHGQQPESPQDHVEQSDEYWTFLPENDLAVDGAIQLQSPGPFDALFQTMSSSTSPSIRSQPAASSNEQPNDQHSSGSSDHNLSVQSPYTASIQTVSDLQTSPGYESHVSDVSGMQQTATHVGYSEDRTSSTREPRSDGVESIDNRPSTRSTSRVSPNSPGAQRSGGIQKSTGSKGSRKPVGRPRSDTAENVIDNYIISENKKVHNPDQHTVVVAAMRTYRAMIVGISAKSQAGLAAMAVSVGDSSALSTLKAAIQGLRSPEAGEIIRIDRIMSIEERLRVINRAEGHIELFRLVRNYHVMALWRDIASASQGGTDAFVINTPEILASEISRAGNPLHIGKSHVSQGMINVGSTTEGAPTAAIPTRLRKLGERFGRLVQAWGEGVLLLLGHLFTEPRILGPLDGDFDRFVDLMDRSEGERIREVSIAAEGVLHYFRTGDSGFASLMLETVAEEVLREIPRLSHEFVDLLRPAAEDSRTMASVGSSAPSSSRL